MEGSEGGVERCLRRFSRIVIAEPVLEFST